MDTLNSFNSIKDIFPDLVSFTENGKLDWITISSDDFYVIIEGYKIEIERPDKDRETNQQKGKDCVAIYLWDKEASIIDSYYSYDGSEDYVLYSSYLRKIRKNANKIPNILSNIFEKLKNS